MEYITKSYSLDAETIRKIEELARLQDRSASAVIRTLVSHAYTEAFLLEEGGLKIKQYTRSPNDPLPPVTNATTFGQSNNLDPLEETHNVIYPEREK